MAANADPFVAGVTAYLAQRLSLPVAFVDVQPWQERERLLDAGQVEIGWICGAPYTVKVDTEKQPLDLLAAPVMAAPRYGGRPIYFSDVVVHRHSDFHTFAGLRGASWAYNEPRSQSGYHLTRYHLATLGLDGRFFGRVVESGAHQTSLQWILDRRIDAAAIDSTVLETILAAQPEIGEQIRIVDVFGPSPIPPWVIQRSVEPALRHALRHALLHMHEDAAGAALLAAARTARFVEVTDAGYDPIRAMARRSEGINLSFANL